MVPFRRIFPDLRNLAVVGLVALAAVSLMGCETLKPGIFDGTDRVQQIQVLNVQCTVLTSAVRGLAFQADQLDAEDVRFVRENIIPIGDAFCSGDTPPLDIDGALLAIQMALLKAERFD